MGIRRSTLALVGLAAVAALASCASGTASSAEGIDAADVVGPEGAADAASSIGSTSGFPVAGAADPADGSGGGAAPSAGSDPDPVSESDDETTGPATGSETDDPEADRTLLDAAVASADLCEVHAALGALAVSVGDLADLARTLDLISETLDASESLVPDGLDEAWRVMARRIDRARSELSKPDADMASISGIFGAPEYEDAQELIDDWQRTSCG